MTTITRTDGAQQGNALSLSAQQAAKGVSNTQRALRRLLRHKMALIGLGLLIAVLLYVFIGSFTFTEAYANLVDTSRPLQAPSAEHPFGTDSLGRDLLARTIYGGQVSLFIAVTAVILQIMIGTMVGLVSGFIGGTLDAVLMRITETLLSIPQLFIAAITVKAIADPERLKALGLSSRFDLFGRQFSITVIILIVVIGLTSWMRVARIVRATVLSLKEQEFITAARSLGVSVPRIIMRHILPNCLGPIIVAATLGVAGAILTEAYLSFLGLGVKAPTATWGNIMEESNERIKSWFYWFFPALLIMLTVLGINFFGDGLRDAMDPKSKN